MVRQKAMPREQENPKKRGLVGKAAVRKKAKGGSGEEVEDWYSLAGDMENTPSWLAGSGEWIQGERPKVPAARRQAGFWGRGESPGMPGIP